MIFDVLRAGMNMPSPILHISEEDGDYLIILAKQQALLSIFYRGLKQMTISPSTLKICDQYRIKQEYLALQHDDAIRKVQGALNKEEIPYVLLKGAFLRHLYPDFILRTSSDIDILVHKEDIDRAVQTLEKKTDFVKVEKSYHDISMISSRVHLELHFSIKENDEKKDKILIQAWDYAKPTGEGSKYVFLPEYQIFHVIAHMSYHFLHGGLGIRPFLDLWLLRNKTQFDNNLLEQFLTQTGLSQFYAVCSHLSEVWLGNATHNDTTRLLEDFCLSGGVFGNEKFKTAGMQREKRGWKYICSRVFPPKYQVKEYYEDTTGKKHSLSYYYVKRWKNWLSKEKRSDLKRQVNTVLKSDKKYQDEADELFKKLGF